jgi:hypothetical protein
MYVCTQLVAAAAEGLHNLPAELENPWRCSTAQHAMSRLVHLSIADTFGEVERVNAVTQRLKCL